MQLGSGTPADGRQALAVKTPADAKTANPPTLALSTNPTPPLTPVLADDGDASPIAFAGLQASRPDLSSALASPSASLADVPAIATPREFEHDLEIRRDSRGQTVEFGHGAWSVVYSAVCPEAAPASPVGTHEEALPHDLVYVDFTSSHDLSSSTAGSNSHGLGLSALTPPFAAPELLTISALTSSTLAPSKASDTFSLAVTLLTAVTGDLQLYPGAGSMQCLAMSRDGHRVLDFVRSGVNCSRVPRKGTVERLLSPAVVKDPDSRIHPAAWFDLIKSEAKTLLSAASS
ncbi:kinase domain-containing protein [Coccidioides immitis H538.4]|uniref:Kinase domain-containing protein n=1 Tax=Coccidioides immitis H538.4 TaxID=396776 RepID=A0A0J8RSG7_COCIT|nr:kinase domain-containing protein [Coccidioides immitis H538.4]